LFTNTFEKAIHLRLRIHFLQNDVYFALINQILSKKFMYAIDNIYSLVV